MDFGISKVYDPELSTTGRRARGDVGLFAARAVRAGQDGHRSDVYALAATLYMC